MIYLDHAATALWRPSGVEETMMLAYHSVGNPGRGGHEPSMLAAKYLLRSRQLLARYIGAESPEEIVFTQNATMALNIAVHGTLREGDHVITSMAEHNSVLRPLYLAQKQKNVSLSFLPLDDKGRIRLDLLETLLRKNTRAVVITHASNVTGNVTDLSEVCAFTRRHGLLLIVDASQSAGSIPVNVRENGVDILCFTGHKALLGPQGTGGMYVRKGTEVEPLFAGGTGMDSFSREMPAAMPERLEAGTPNVPGIAGLGAAVLYHENYDDAKRHHAEMAREKNFILRVIDIPGIRLYGDYAAEDARRVPVVSLNIEGVDSTELASLLYEEGGICVRAGAHCAPLVHTSFGTVKQGMVRFSFSAENSEQDVNSAAQLLRTLAQSLRA